MTEKPGPEPSASTPNNNATTTTNSGAPAQASTGSGPAPNSGNNPQPASTGAGAATGTNPNTNRGLPYYEKLRRELRDTIQRKRVMDKTMVCPTFYPPLPYYAIPILMEGKGPTRRPNLPLRKLLPRRNNSRKHSQGFRQLHQGLFKYDGIQRGRSFLISWRCGWSRDETKGCGVGY